MKFRIFQLLLVALPSAALALPAEDHWTVQMDAAEAAALEESTQLIAQEK